MLRDYADDRQLAPPISMKMRNSHNFGENLSFEAKVFADHIEPRTRKVGLGGLK
jgi:hypothetical protein